MDEFENAPINVNATLMAISIKLNAVITALNGEQLERYNQTIEIEKKNASVALSPILSPEDIDEFLRLLE